MANRCAGIPSCDYKPVVGPYGTLRFDSKTDRWKSALNDEGRRLCEEYLAQWPDLSKYAMTVCPGLLFFVRKKMTNDEINAVFYEAVVSAVIRLDPTRACLNTVVAYSLKGALQNVIRMTIKQYRLRTVGFYTCNEDDDINEPPAPEKHVADLDVLIQVEKMLDRLKPLERQVLCEHFGIGCVPSTFTAIANRMNRTKQRVEQIADNGLNRIRAYMVNDLEPLRQSVIDSLTIRPMTTNELSKIHHVKPRVMADILQSHLYANRVEMVVSANRMNQTWYLVKPLESAK